MTEPLPSTNASATVATTTHPLDNNNDLDYCEEAATTDTNELNEVPYAYRKRGFGYSTTSSNASSETITPETDHDNNTDDNAARYSSIADGFSLNNIQIPIVGYEIIEERARFTVFKLRIENRASGDCWYVFRRYTDFVRLCRRLRQAAPHLRQYLPRKQRWLGDNFATGFLDERSSGLQSLVDVILGEPDLVDRQEVREFFCLNEPPLYTETSEESRAMFEALEDTIYQLKQQIRDKDNIIDSLHDSLLSKSNENVNLRKILHDSTINCTNCKMEYENIIKPK